MRPFKRIKISLLFFTFSLGICQSQETDQMKFQVLDKVSHSPMVYATVILKNAKIGVISDNNGNFRIPSVYRTKHDTLRISSIGYETLFLPLMGQTKNEINKIFVAVKTESLKEVNLVYQKKKRKMSPGRIVKEAIRKIPENYSLKPFSFIAYYRDYQQVSNNQYPDKMNLVDKNPYINLNEGIIQVYDAGFGTDRLTNSLNQTVLYNFKANDKFPIDNSLTVPYDNREQKYLDGVIITPLGGNELNLLTLTNAIRNYNRMSFSFAHVFNEHFLYNHIFTTDQIVYLEDQPYYKISFTSNSKMAPNSYKAFGNITISKKDFGIQHLDYNLMDVFKDRLLYRVNIEYRPIGKHYYLNYITFNNYFEVKGGDFFKVDRVEYHHESAGFQIFFNEDVDLNSMDDWQKKFKFFSDNEPLILIGLDLIEPHIISIRINTSVELDKAILDDGIRYEIKNLQDVKGRILNERNMIRADQFREIFVQKVFPEARLDTGYNFVDKNHPLKMSEQNIFKGTETYWINTPLKASK